MSDPDLEGVATVRYHALGESNDLKVGGNHLNVNDGALLITGNPGEVAAFAPGQWTYAHIVAKPTFLLGVDNPDDLRARLTRAVGRLDERIEATRAVNTERIRLEGKKEGVQLALSYLHEMGREIGGESI